MSSDENYKKDNGEDKKDNQNPFKRKKQTYSQEQKPKSDNSDNDKSEN